MFKAKSSVSKFDQTVFTDVVVSMYQKDRADRQVKALLDSLLKAPNEVFEEYYLTDPNYLDEFEIRVRCAVARRRAEIRFEILKGLS
jgi:hypothetical protein